MTAPFTKPETRSEIRQGWSILAATTLCFAFGIAGLTTFPIPYLVSGFVSEFGWDRNEVGYMATFVTAAAFLCAPIVGRLCDRFSPRRVAISSILLMPIGLLLTTCVSGSVWNLYAASFLTAVLGSGTLFVSYSRVLNASFRKSRGLALGITAAGTGITAFLTPFILLPIISGYGWRGAYVALAGFALLSLPFALALFKDTEHVDVAIAQEPGLPMSAIVRDRRFWALGFGTLLISVTVGGAIIYFLPVFTDMGGGKESIERAASLCGLSSFVCKIAVGSILDRTMHPRLIVMFLLTAAVVIILPVFFGPLTAPLFALSLGLILGVEIDIAAFLTTRYFGLRCSAQAYGTLYAFAAFGFTVGPLFAGSIYSGAADHLQLLTAWSAMLAGGALFFGSLGKFPSGDEFRPCV